MVNERREKRRQFFGPYGDPANWQTAQAATTPPAAPVTAAARQYPFVGDKRAAAASVASTTATQPLPTMVNAARPEREYPFVGAKRAEAGKLGLPAGPSVELPPRQQPDPKRTYPFIGKKRPEGWVPDTWKASPQLDQTMQGGPRGFNPTAPPQTGDTLDWANNPEVMPPPSPQRGAPPAQADWASHGPNMEAQTPTPAPQAAQQGRFGAAGDPGSGQIDPKLSQRDEQIRANMGQIDDILASGKQFDGRTMAKIQQMKQQAGFLRGGTDRVPVGPDGLPLNRQPQQTTQQRLEGMDKGQNTRTTADGYTFEGAAGDAGRFFAPTGKGDPEAERGWAIAEQERRARQPQQRVFRQQPQLFTKENSPGMGWKQRKSLNEQMLQNQQSGANARLQAQTTMATTAASNQADLERARMIEATGQERNQIDKMNVEDQMAGRALENQARRFTLGQDQQVAALQKRYMESTDPAEKKQLQEHLQVLGGMKQPEPKFFTDQTVDGMGNETRTTYVMDRDGVRRAVPQGQQQGLPMPTDKKQLIKGEVYATPRGPATWNGKTYIPVQMM